MYTRKFHEQLQSYVPSLEKIDLKYEQNMGSFISIMGSVSYLKCYGKEAYGNSNITDLYIFHRFMQNRSFPLTEKIQPNDIIKKYQDVFTTPDTLNYLHSMISDFYSILYSTMNQSLLDLISVDITKRIYKKTDTLDNNYESWCDIEYFEDFFNPNNKNDEKMIINDIPDDDIPDEFFSHYDFNRSLTRMEKDVLKELAKEDGILNKQLLYYIDSESGLRNPYLFQLIDNYKRNHRWYYKYKNSLEEIENIKLPSKKIRLAYETDYGPYMEFWLDINHSSLNGNCGKDQKHKWCKHRFCKRESKKVQSPLTRDDILNMYPILSTKPYYIEYVDKMIIDFYNMIYKIFNQFLLKIIAIDIRMRHEQKIIYLETYKYYDYFTFMLPYYKWDE